jgi:hypothetical protein
VRVPNRPIVEPYPADKLPMMSRMLKSLEGKGLDSIFKCDTEVSGECLEGRAVGQAFPRR